MEGAGEHTERALASGMGVGEGSRAHGLAVAARALQHLVLQPLNSILRLACATSPARRLSGGAEPHALVHPIVWARSCWLSHPREGWAAEAMK